jgi:hypothetical protein
MGIWGMVSIFAPRITNWQWAIGNLQLHSSTFGSLQIPHANLSSFPLNLLTNQLYHPYQLFNSSELHSN